MWAMPSEKTSVRSNKYTLNVSGSMSQFMVPANAHMEMKTRMTVNKIAN